MKATPDQLHTWACDLLAARAMAGLTAVRDIDALRRTIANRKRTEYADKARWYLAQPEPPTTPEALANLLEPPVPAPNEPVNSSARLPLWRAHDRTEMPDVDLAHRRIDCIRRALRSDA